MRRLLEEAGLATSVVVESAGTNAFRVGGAPDPRSQATAREHGIDLTSACRQFEPDDFARFDHVVAMDRDNVHDLLSLAPHAAAVAKLSLLRSFDLAPDRAAADDEVPDPYLGARGFDRVFDICQAGCRGLLEHLKANELASP